MSRALLGAIGFFLAAAALEACSGSARAALERFPIGIYNVDDPNLLPMMRENGFDSIFVELRGEPLESYARRARKEGIRLLIPPLGGGKPSDGTRSWPVEAWYLHDEPEVHKVPPEEMRRMSEETRRWDPHRPQIVVIGSGSAAERYGGIGDILMVDWYPVPHKPLDSVADQLDAAKRFLPRGKPLWMVLQAMDWRDYADPKRPGPAVGRFPDHAEIRFMSYLAVLRGAKGLFYFSFRKPSGKTLLDYPEQWQALTRVSREMRRMEPVFARGRLIHLPFPPNPDGPQARAWRYRGRDYVVILNRKGHVMQKLPEELLKPEWRPLFESRRDPRELLKAADRAWYLRPYQVLILESGWRWRGPSARIWQP